MNWQRTLRSVSLEVHKTFVHNKGVEDETDVTGTVLLERVPRSKTHWLFVTGLMTVKKHCKAVVITFKTPRQKKQENKKCTRWFDLTSIGNTVTACCPQFCLQSTAAQEATGANIQLTAHSHKSPWVWKWSLAKISPQNGFSFYISQYMISKLFVLQDL